MLPVAKISLVLDLSHFYIPFYIHNNTWERKTGQKTGIAWEAFIK